MHRPEIHDQATAVAWKENELALTEILPKMAWPEGKEERILDVGCGPGVITSQLLLPLVRERTGDRSVMLIGTDVSSNMIKHATAM